MDWVSLGDGGEGSSWGEEITASGWAGAGAEGGGAGNYRAESRLKTPVHGWQAELFAEGGAGVEETEVFGMGDSDLLSTPSYQATRLPAWKPQESLKRGSREAYSTDVNSCRN